MGDVHTQLLSLLLGGLRSVRLLLLLLLLASSGLLGRLLTLLGCLTSGLLPLLSRLSGGVLCLLGRLSGLVGHLTGRLLGLPRRLSSRVLHALRGLPDLIGDSAQRTSASLAFFIPTTGEPAGEPANGVLHLLGGSSSGLLGLTRYLSDLFGRLSGGVLSLLGGSSSGILSLTRHLASRLLSLPRRLTSGVLRLLGSSLCELLHLLLGLLGRFVHVVLYSGILCRLIHRALELRVGVDHLLDLGLCVALGELLRILLQLGAVILDLALEAAY